MCMPKAPSSQPSAPISQLAQAPQIAPIDKAMAPALAVATSATAGLKKKRAGTKALRIDMVAPQGGSGLNIN
jgi:hypothetical protein